MLENKSEVYSFSAQKTIRIDEFLQEELVKMVGQNCSNSKIRRLIISGAVTVNGRVINRPAFELRGKSSVSVKFDREKFFYEKQPDDVAFSVTSKAVLYETEDLIFINKPAFFPVEQTIVGNRANLHDAVVDYLWQRTPELRNPPYVGIMHRLDRETSGVILFTKNRSINKIVSEMFQNHDFTKEYLAIVEKSDKHRAATLTVGKKFSVEMYMGRISGKSQKGKWGRLSQRDGGLFSKTDFEILQECKIEGRNCFLIKCDLYTGRTHQIRVHLSESGFPILGDELYGGRKAQRMYLHAFCLKKITGDLQFDVKAPVDFLSDTIKTNKN